MTKVSVIVPVYNVEQYIDKCLKSLVDQDFEDYEVIVVNDGSPDNSQKIVDEYTKKYPKIIKSYIKKNGGVSSARNYGITKAKGEYITFVDSDDYVAKEYLDELYNTAVNEKSDIVVCNMYAQTGEKTEVMTGLLKYSNDDIKNAMISIPAVWNKLFKRSLFIENNVSFPEKLLAEDLAVVTRILCNVNKISYIEKPLYYYLIRTNSLSHQTKFNPKSADIIKSLDIIRKYFKEKQCYKKFKNELEYIHIVHMLHSYMVNIHKFNECFEKNKEVVKLMKKLFPKWRKNKYLKKQGIKYKIVCNLIYKKQIKLLRLILK